MTTPRRIPARLAAPISALALFAAFAAPSTAASPQDVADARFAAMNGPLVPFVVKPGQFGMDAHKVLTDVPALLDQVDKDNLIQDTTELAGMFRSSENDQSNLDAAAAFVDTKFRNLGYDPETMPVTYHGKSMPNISVTIPGTQCSDKVLILSAHYDARGPENPGADDDASGMAALFEVARILRTNPQPVTIRLTAYSFEEDGLIGSFAMADHDVAAHTDVIGAVSMDMLGYTDASKTDPFVGLPQDYLAMVADPTSAQLAKAFGAAAYTYTPEFPAAAAVIDPKIMSDIFRSDHAPYVLKGFQGMMATDTANFRNPNYHTPGDTLDTLDWNFLYESTRVILAGMVTDASSDQNADGTADQCQDLTPPPPATPTAAPAATPVAARPAYTG